MVDRIKIKVLRMVVVIGMKLNIPYAILKTPNDALRALTE